jgi:hypothetical protein
VRALKKFRSRAQMAPENVGFKKSLKKFKLNFVCPWVQEYLRIIPE